jgi:hypothetical protein
VRLARSRPAKGWLAILALAALASLSVSVVVDAGLSVWRGSSAQRAIGVLPDRILRPGPGVVRIPTRPAHRHAKPLPPAPAITAHAPPVAARPVTQRAVPQEPTRPVRHPQRPTEPRPPVQVPPVRVPPVVPAIHSPEPAAHPAVVRPPKPVKADVDEAAEKAAKAAANLAKEQAKAANKLAEERAKAAAKLAKEQDRVGVHDDADDGHDSEAPGPDEGSAATRVLDPLT